MTGAAGADAPVLAQHLATFRASGAWKADPARFRFMESLVQRMQGQPQAVRGLLEQRLQRALDEFTAAVVARQPASDAGRPRTAVAGRVDAGPLAALTASLREHHADDSTADELPSVRRFREAWESGRTLDRLEQALARSPANAGPLNSHALVVRSLAVMGAASVDYLRRFLTSAETLQWLEAAKLQLPQGKAGKGVKRGKGRR